MIRFNSNLILFVSKSLQFNSSSMFQDSNDFDSIQIQYLEIAGNTKVTKIISKSIPIPVHRNNINDV